MEFLLFILNPLLTGVTTALVLFLLQRKLDKKPQKKRKPSAQAMNSVAVHNSIVDHQRIKTAEIEIPVIAEDVLEYGPGELGPNYPSATRLYYAAEAISDPEYLETVLRSPLQIETHDLNTGENNIDVAGMPNQVWYDSQEKRVKAKGVIVGKDRVEYVARSKERPGFGTSAFISFLEIDRVPGIAPNGKPYDARVRKAVNNHIAILDNVRDPNNVVLAMNARIDTQPERWAPPSEMVDRFTAAVSEGDEAAFKAVVSDIYNTMGGSPGSKTMPIDKDEFKAAMNEYESDKDREEETVNRIVNTVLEKLKPASDNSKNEDEPVKASESDQAKNEDEPEKTDDDTAVNALPSEDMVKDFSTHLGITFRTTPTLSQLGKYVGVAEADPAKLISALNAKRQEFKTAQPAAQNAAPATSLGELLNNI